MKKLTRLATTTSLVAGALATLTTFGVAHAQTEAEEEIVVTGTRIRQANLVATTGTVTIDAERLEAGSELEVGGLLRDLPASGIAAATPQTTAGLVSTSFGVSSFNLRNLTENRTLVLVDNRRFVSGVPGQNIVDLNAIPPEMVERIDVVTGGASAVYGSDALAGVVNIILRDDFDGVTFTGQGGITEEGDAENFRASIVAGSDFADDRGHALLSLGWSRENGAFARDRDFLQTDNVSLAALGIGPTDDVRSVLQPFLSSYSERGRFAIPNGPTLTEDDAGVVRPFATAVDGFNRNPNRAISAELERYSLAADVDFRISESMNWFGQGVFNTTIAATAGEGFPLDGYNVYGGNNPANTPQCADFDGDGDSECKFGIPILSAIVPVAIRNAAIAANPTIAPEDIVIGFRRRMTEVGNRNGDATRDTFRLVTGIEGDFPSGLQYEASFTYGRTTSSQSSDGQVNVLNMRNALDVEVGPGGELRCSSEVARLEGCVPIDIFGRGDISPEAAQYVNAKNSRRADVDQWVFNAYVTGDAWQMPGGPATFVLGVEHRDESTADVPDKLTQSGLNASNKTPPTQGSLSVRELFGELRVPLISDAAFADSVEVSLAARFSDYSTIGATTAYAAGLNWQVVDPLRVRGQYSLAVRAPNIFELFSGPQQTFPVINDPCQGLTLSAGRPTFFVDPADNTSGIDASTVGGNQATRCLADPFLAARVARDGFFIPSQPELQGTGGFTSGNPGLGEETAETYSAGLVFDPSSGWLAPLSVSVDYYNITIEDAISTFGRQLTVDRCYTTGEAQFCGLINRATAGDFVGFLAFVNQNLENLAELNAEGVDVQFDYTFDLGGAGTLGFNALYSRLLEQSNVPLPGASLVDDTGEFGAPENRGNIALTYEVGDVRLRWDARIIGKMTIENDGGTFAGAEVGLRHFHDLQATWQVSDSTRFILGVDNVLNEYVFLGGTSGEIGGSILATTVGHRTAPEIYDGLGRRAYAAVRLAF